MGASAAIESGEVGARVRSPTNLPTGQRGACSGRSDGLTVDVRRRSDRFRQQLSLGGGEAGPDPLDAEHAVSDMLRLVVFCHKKHS